MATLVLSTVGNALGGPVGGAIGALIGQSIDQQVFGPGPRQGPRLGDLAVQTSNYGTAIPRIYGRMRVAGSVIWATDLKESSALQSGGKNQPDVQVYSYSVNMAVALSSRTAAGIGRIWADGKLIRGAAGDFKVKTKFRFHPGDEDQVIDPLIAAAEGIVLTPAYRGLALAVFEDLELAEFGNRIPFLTAEIFGDGEPPTIGAILTDASAGIIRSSDATRIHGYAAHGTTIRASVEPLIEHFPVNLRQSEKGLEAGFPTLFAVGDDELGCAPDGKSEAKSERTVIPERAIPSSLTIDYYDPARDYQTGRMRASAASRNGKAEAVDLPIVLQAEAARGIVENSLARRWAGRERVTLRLPPQFMKLRPGDLIVLPGGSQRWLVRDLRIEAMVAVIELQPEGQLAASLVADPGRRAPTSDVVAAPTLLALFDLPDLGGGPSLQLHLAAASSTNTWRQVPMEVAVGGTIIASASAQAETVLGRTLTPLASGEPTLFDTISTVEVELANAEQWLESRDDDALIGGANLAVIGQEIIHFGQVVPIGPKRFRLSRMLRGRFGSEWAMAGHVVGEAVALLDARSLRALALPDVAIGAELIATAHAVGDGSGTSIAVIVSGESLRPPSPVHIRASLTSGTLSLSWVRRSRSGFAWAGEVDAPLGESTERYRIRLQGSAGLIEVETQTPSVILSATHLASVGSGPATISVAQVGDRALSRWSSIAITLP